MSHVVREAWVHSRWDHKEVSRILWRKERRGCIFLWALVQGASFFHGDVSLALSWLCMGGGGGLWALSKVVNSVFTPGLPRCIPMVNFSDTLLVVLILDIVYDCHLCFPGNIPVIFRRTFQQVASGRLQLTLF